jgi:hypothetical protein
LLKIPILKEMIINAELRSNAMGVLNNSITHGKGNIAGFIGEEVANAVIGGTIVDTHDYDILTQNGKRVDVKTKRCTSAPKDYYECSIAKYNTKQNCDCYVFVRVEYTENGWDRAWLLGYYPKDLYFQKARYLQKGQIVDNNNFKVKADCYNMKIKDLLKF